jgi:GNAT superfamily N-acetyltransferase
MATINTNLNLNLQFRVATPDDAERIQQLTESAFRTIDSREGWTGNEELASQFRLEVSEVLANILKLDIVSFIAVDDKNDALVATIEVSQRGNIGRIFSFAVDDRYQRAGIGRQVLAYAEDYCRHTWSVDKFSLNALSPRIALIEWYMRRGYQKIDTSPFPREKFSHLALPDDLCFIELEKTFSEATDVNQSA